MENGPRAGHRVGWRRAGQGRTPALLAHCSLAHSRAFKGLMAELDQNLSMTAFDLPGHGASGPPLPGQTMQQAVGDIARSFLDETGPAHLIGHSFGGTAFLRLAVEAPDLVLSLTLIEPPFYPAARAIGAPEMQVQDTLDMPARLRFAEGDMAGAAELFYAGWGFGLPWKTVPEDQRDYMIATMPHVEGCGTLLNSDQAGILAPGRLERISCPVLLMRGEDSPPAIAAVFRALEPRLADVRTVVVPGAGHMLPLTHPQPVADAIRLLIR